MDHSPPFFVCFFLLSHDQIDSSTCVGLSFDSTAWSAMNMKAAMRGIVGTFVPLVAGSCLPEAIPRAQRQNLVTWMIFFNESLGVFKKFDVL